MKDGWKVGVGACVFIVAICIIVDFIIARAMLNTKKIDNCVIVRPLEAVSGHIGYQNMHSVLYRGTTKETGEVCIESVWVTESEYERAIYGEKRLDLGLQDSQPMHGSGE